MGNMGWVVTSKWKIELLKLQYHFIMRCQGNFRSWLLIVHHKRKILLIVIISLVLYVLRLERTKSLICGGRICCEQPWKKLCSNGKLWMIHNDIPPPKKKKKKKKGREGWYITKCEPRAYFLKYAVYAYAYICPWMNLHIHGTVCMSNILTWLCLYAQIFNLTLSIGQIFYIGWFFCL